jgi:hypothetical protein
MKMTLRRLLPALLITSLSIAAHAGQVAAIQPRIGAIDNGDRVTLQHSHTTRINGATDLGAVAPDKRLTGITMVFSRSAAQEAALQALLTAQLDPSSPQFHQWLTPAQFGAQFGLAEADLAAAQTWLQQQGFTNFTVSPSRDRLSFDGTASQVATAFGAGLHNYQAADGTQHFAPSHDLTLPAALAANVVTVANLSSFRAKPHIRRLPETAANPRFTSSISGSHFVTPLDLATIYDITPAYNAGYNGSGQSIAVVGQSFIYAADIADFQNALGLPVKPPTMVLVPASGVPTEYSGDESESDLDIEYSGSIAPGANIYFVYTGSSSNTGAFGAAVYAIDEDIAPIISVSYGECEVNAQSDSAAIALNSALPQAAAQGQTVIAAAGDSGSTDCYGDTNLTTLQQETVSVDFPAYSQYVLAAGGSEFPASTVAVGNTQYWTAQGSTDTVSSALSYIPEQVWNDDAAAGSLNAAGGGTSTTVLRPSWQSNLVPGIAAIGGSYRLVPDVSLDASDSNAPLVLCSSDTSFYHSGQDFSCNSGLRDSVTGDLTDAGGTSFVAPTLAGLVAILNQARNYTGGQGTIAPTFYSLASNPITYASAFHDITTGGNQCLVTTGICVTPATTDYAAATGYDEASGLGSVDFNKLLTAWPANSVTTGLSTPTITLTPATTTPALGVGDNLTVTLTGSAGTVGGTVNIKVDGNTVASPTLSAGTTTYAFSTATAGQHVVTAVYAGSGTYSTATASAVLQAGGSFTISAPSISVAAGSSITTTFTATPVNGYAGTVAYVLTGNNSGLLNACFSPSLPTGTVNGVTPTTTSVTIYTSTTSCTSAGATATLGGLARKGAGTNISSKNNGPLSHRPFEAPLAIAAAGLLAVFGLRRKGSRSLQVSASLGLLLMLTCAGISGCSSGGTAVAPTSTTTTTPTGSATAGTYLITVSGYDYSGNPNAPFSSNLNSTTTFTITVH